MSVLVCATSSCCVVSRQYSEVTRNVQTSTFSSSVSLTLSPSFNRLWKFCRSPEVEKSFSSL